MLEVLLTLRALTEVFVGIGELLEEVTSHPRDLTEDEILELRAIRESVEYGFLKELQHRRSENGEARNHTSPEKDQEEGRETTD